MIKAASPAVLMLKCKELRHVGTQVLIFPYWLRALQESSCCGKVEKDFNPPDKTPYIYDNKPFQLDGLIDLDIVFDGKTVCTPVYVKIDSPDPLLLSEGVCRQLGNEKPDHQRKGSFTPKYHLCKLVWFSQCVFVHSRVHWLLWSWRMVNS